MEKKVKIFTFLLSKLSSIINYFEKYFGMQLCAITTDNASNNATMIDELMKIMSHINPLFDRKCHMTCLAHVLNLAIQDGLKELKTTANEDTSVFCMSSSKSLGDVVSRVRKIVKVIRSSPAYVEKYEKFFHDLGISSTSISNSYISTPWNSTYDMLSEEYEKKTILEKKAMFVLIGRPNKHYLISNEE